MNLLDGVVDDGHIRFTGSNARFPVSPDLGVTTGDRVRIGVRPSEMEVDRDQRSTGEWLRLPGRVVLAERLGRQVELDIEVGDDHLIVVEDSDHAPGEGEDVTVRVPLSNVHVFAAAAEGKDSARLGSAAGRVLAPLPEEAR